MNKIIKFKNTFKIIFDLFSFVNLNIFCNKIIFELIIIKK